MDNASISTEAKKFLNFINGPTILHESLPICYDFMYNVKRKIFPPKAARIIVRGKVKKIVKLSMLHGEDGYYFHLEGTITDTTDTMEVIFSSEVSSSLNYFYF